MEIQENNYRTAKLTLLIGTNGTGKTTLLHKILDSTPQKTLIITPDDIEWQDCTEVDLTLRDDFLFVGRRRHIYNPIKDFTLNRLDNYKRGILVFDDCRSYFPATTPPQLRNLLIRRRQREVDIFAVGHGFTEIPPVFFTFASNIILFRTTDNIIRRKDCLKDFELVKSAQDRVNNRTLKNPYYFEHIKFY